MNASDFKPLIGKKLVEAVDVEAEFGFDQIRLTFEDGTTVEFGMACGNTPEDYPYVFCYVSEPNKVAL